VLYDKKVVKQVDVPSYSGSFGILANHVPCLAVLKPGVVTVYEDDGSSKKYFGTLHLLCVSASYTNNTLLTHPLLSV
jgi:F-type H+-transporting ATPase subunit delta